MALRTQEERRALLAAWLADPRNAGRKPPVEIDPPGLHAPRRPSRRARAAVEQLVTDHQRELARIGRKGMEAMAPVIAKAEREVAAKLAAWIETTPDGELRWTAQSYRVALLQLRRAGLDIARALQTETTKRAGEAQELALEHLASEVARFSEVFGGGLRRLSLNHATVIADGSAFIIPQVHTSAARYAGMLAKDIQERLAVDILKGAPVRETVDRLVAQGGPRGLVSLQGIAGELGAVEELIPEGLFVRYRYWAERIVRTETVSAYGRTKTDGIRAAQDLIPHLGRRWVADASACAAVCIPLSGMTVSAYQPFPSSRGPVEHEPAHPNCGCTTVPWSPDWAAF